MSEVVPELSEADALEAAARLFRTSTLARVALDDVERGVAPSWWGDASEAYYASRGQVSGRLNGLQITAHRLATAIETYADDAGRAITRWRQTQVDRDQALAHPSTARLTNPSTADVDVHRFELEMTSAERDYRLAVAELSQAAAGTCLALDDERGLEEHLSDGFHAYVATAVVEPAATSIENARLVFESPSTAWERLSQAPSNAWNAYAVNGDETLRELLAVQDFQNGDIGKGAGTVIAGLGLTGLAREALRVGGSDPKGRDRDVSHPPDGGGSLLPQTTDELFASVDLRRQELHKDAHTIRNHVGWSDDDLLARYDQAAALAESRGRPAKPMSSFTDLPTAEAAITRLLRENEAEVRSCGQGGRYPLVLSTDTGQSIGRSVTRGADGEIDAQDATGVTVVLKRAGDGTVFVYSSFPRVAP